MSQDLLSAKEGRGRRDGKEPGEEMVQVAVLWRAMRQLWRFVVLPSLVKEAERGSSVHSFVEHNAKCP